MTGGSRAPGPAGEGARHTFGKERRVRRRADFLRVQASKTRVVTSHFVLLVDARDDRGPARLGVVVTRKVGGAVQRARVKRICREAFRTTPELLPAGIDLVVIARPGAPGLSSQEVRAEWTAVGARLRDKCKKLLTKPPVAPAPGATTG